MLTAQMEPLCRSLQKAIKQHRKNVATRQAAFVLLRKLLEVTDGGLSSAQFELFLPAIRDAVRSTSHGISPNLRLDAFLTLQSGLLLLPPAEYLKQQQLIVDVYLAALKDPYSKIVLDSLHSCQLWLEVLRPDPSKKKMPLVAVSNLYEAVLQQASNATADQEVKDASIATLGTFFQYAGDIIAAKFQSEALPLLMERTKNEVTRMAAIKAWLSVIRSTFSAKHLKLEQGLPSLVEEIIPLLRKNQRSLRVLVLELLLVIGER